MLTPSNPLGFEPPSSRKIWLAIALLFLFAAFNIVVAVLLAPG